MIKINVGDIVQVKTIFMHRPARIKESMEGQIGYVHRIVSPIKSYIIRLLEKENIQHPLYREEFTLFKSKTKINYYKIKYSDKIKCTKRDS